MKFYATFCRIWLYSVAARFHLRRFFHRWLWLRRFVLSPNCHFHRIDVFTFLKNMIKDSLDFFSLPGFVFIWVIGFLLKQNNFLLELSFIAFFFACSAHQGMCLSDCSSPKFRLQWGHYTNVIEIREVWVWENSYFESNWSLFRTLILK